MMQIFLGTVIIVTLCCLAMGLGLVITGKPLAGGCGKQLPGSAACDACLNRTGKHDCEQRPDPQVGGGPSC